MRSPWFRTAVTTAALSHYNEMSCMRYPASGLVFFGACARARSRFGLGSTCNAVFRLQSSGAPSRGTASYALGSEQRELVRLGVQHGVFAAEARSLYRHAGISLGDTVVDLGCG